MVDVVVARDAYLAARDQVEAARLALGRAIMEARRRNVSQTEIASELRLTREQVRRYQVEYQKKLAKQTEAATAAS
jgi:hypothetical protein